MESRCAICGNRTEDLDLATVEFEGVSVKACPYCRKQLSQFLQDPARNAAWLSGVLRVDEKHTRTPEATAALTRLAYQNDIARPAPANAEAPPANPAAKPAVTATKNAEPLEERVDKLEKQLKSLKRRLLISKILEIVVPLVLVLVLLVILLRSGALQSIFDYYSSLEDLANQM